MVRGEPLVADRPAAASSRLASSSATKHARGAIERANSTHMGWSGASPSSPIAARPVRTVVVSCAKPRITCGEAMKWIAEAMQPGELRSRNIAATGASA